MNYSNLSSEAQTASEPRVLLTNTIRWATGARVAIGLAQADCNVFAICPSRHPMLKTSAARQTFAYSGVRPLDSLLTAIKASDPHIIIPCDDRGVQHLHELYEHACKQEASGSKLAALIERSLGSPASYPIVSSRYELLKIARDEGIRVPHTHPILAVDDLKALDGEQTLPWVLKADGTWGGGGVKIAQTPAEAEQFFVELSRAFGVKRVIKRLCVNRDSFWLRPWWRRFRPAVIAQAYIQGCPANCAVVCWQGKVLAGIGVEVVSAQERTGPASVVRVVDNREMMFAAKQLARRLGLSGIFGLDFVIEDRTGAAYLIEMNPRCTPLCHLQLGKGRDMARALWAQLSGEPIPDTSPITQNDVIAYFPQAWISKSEYLQSSFHDVPQGEPDLVQELLQPWPDRSFLFRVFSLLHQITNPTSKARALTAPDLRELKLGKDQTSDRQLQESRCAKARTS